MVRVIACWSEITKTFITDLELAHQLPISIQMRVTTEADNRNPTKKALCANNARPKKNNYSPVDRDRGLTATNFPPVASVRSSETRGSGRDCRMAPQSAVDWGYIGSTSKDTFSIASA